MIGVALVIASACVFNNYFDRDIDAKMTRTKDRPSVSGTVSPRAALIYGAVLGLAGFVLLYIYVNALTTYLILVGFFVYVFWYTPLKPCSASAVYVGAVAGAAPIVAGYTAVTDRIDWVALFLFLFLFVWQLPHFFAIAAYRYDEYAAAGVPLLVRHPTARHKRLGRQIFFGSLVVLVVFCIVLALQPLFR
jgi:protoheme IX farnesyltransferase